MPDEKQVEKQVEKSNVVCLSRLGNVQALVMWKGEGPYRRPIIRLTKVVDPAILSADDNAVRDFEIQEIAALHKLCDILMNEAFQLQLLMNESLVEKKP